MKRLQIYIEEELDEALALEAARAKTSKAALIRKLVADAFGRPKARDGVAELAGRYDYATGDIDEVIYGR